MKKGLKWIVGFFILLFVAFAIVQYNDPDPYLWIAVYGFMAVLGVSVLLKPLPNIVYFLTAVGCGIWAFFQWPVHWEGIGETMLNENTERARESLGLIICSAVAVFFAAIKKQN